MPRLSQAARRALLAAGLAILLLLMPVRIAIAQPARAPADSALGVLIHEYIALYRNDTLDRWAQLFLPGFTATFTNTDGTTTTLSRDEFVERQRRGFAGSREMSEVLENVRPERRGSIASVGADFVFTADGVSRRGRLVLLVVRDSGVWRISSLLFSYHDE